MNTNINVNHPVGAHPDPWQPEGYRVWFGQRRPVPGVKDYTIALSAVELLDGGIDNGDTIEPPSVHLEGRARAYNAAEARALAAALLDAADQLDQWAGAARPAGV